jgi:HK97 family phage prohead protease
MAKMQYKNFLAEDIEADAKGRTIIGHAAVFGNRDSYGDIIEPGAFSKTLAERGHKVKVGYNHFTLIGKPIEMRQDDTGLYTESRISDTEAGRDVLTLVRDGVVDEMSIAYETVKSWDEEKEGSDGKIQRVRHLTELRLHEYGPVDHAANEEAVISGVKNLAYQFERGGLDDATIRDIKAAIEQLEDAIERAGQPEQSTAEPSSIDTQLCRLSHDFTSILGDAVKSHKIRGYIYG